MEAHFKKIGFNFVDMFKEWFESIFLGYYPLNVRSMQPLKYIKTFQLNLRFQVVLQIFVAFLNEGIKIYFRYAYATLKTFKK